MTSPLTDTPDQTDAGSVKQGRTPLHRFVVHGAKAMWRVFKPFNRSPTDSGSFFSDKDKEIILIFLFGLLPGLFCGYILGAYH